MALSVNGNAVFRSNGFDEVPLQMSPPVSRGLEMLDRSTYLALLGVLERCRGVGGRDGDRLLSIALAKLLECDTSVQQGGTEPVNRDGGRVGGRQSRLSEVGELDLRNVGIGRYKTERCRPFEETGHCKYGDKCQFAHGAHELRSLSRHPKYKTELCRTFHTVGFCPYGPRCHFVHHQESPLTLHADSRDGRRVSPTNTLHLAPRARCTSESQLYSPASSPSVSPPSRSDPFTSDLAAQASSSALNVALWNAGILHRMAEQGIVGSSPGGGTARRGCGMADGQADDAMLVAQLLAQMRVTAYAQAMDCERVVATRLGFNQALDLAARPVFSEVWSPINL